MKILLFIDSLGPGGAQRQLTGLAVMLKNLDFDVVVLTYHNIDFYKGYLDSNQVRSEVIGDDCEYIQRIIRVRKFIKTENPHWVIAYQETPSLIASLVRMMGVNFNLIVSERNTTQHITLRDIVRFSLYRVAKFVVPNSYSQEKFLYSRYKWMRGKLQTITNFVDFESFPFNIHERKQLPLIVVAASIWPPKNTLGFIEAIRILFNRGILCEVMWYGYSESNREYYSVSQAMIEKYGLSKNFLLLPKTNNIQHVYSMSDYFCLPSFYEGVPNVIAEAMATGRPILCSNVCDNPRYVNEKNGFLFDPTNPIDIADKIEKALSISDEQYNEMCHVSRIRSESLLSKSNFIKKYLDLLNKY